MNRRNFLKAAAAVLAASTAQLKAAPVIPKDNPAVVAGQLLNKKYGVVNVDQASVAQAAELLDNSSCIGGLWRDGDLVAIFNHWKLSQHHDPSTNVRRWDGAASCIEGRGVELLLPGVYTMQLYQGRRVTYKGNVMLTQVNYSSGADDVTTREITFTDASELIVEINNEPI